ncbi:MAG: HEPN domain-containing protein [Flavobacteriaceae bacterium]|nr:HEPN domain-containing protein [Flavobacteriaceae bacterium]NNK70016.1 HEPN domain-containing protein [Flavobacteriaceae bacterium]
MNMTAKTFYEEAGKKLSQASEELYRPEEDVVTYLVCQSSHLAIENYLKGFLIQNEVNPESFSSVDEMFSECKKINSKFAEVNLEGHSFEPHTDESRYCDSRVSRCYELANSLDTFLREERIIG